MDFYVVSIPFIWHQMLDNFPRNAVKYLEAVEMFFYIRILKIPWTEGCLYKNGNRKSTSLKSKTTEVLSIHQEDAWLGKLNLHGAYWEQERYENRPSMRKFKTEQRCLPSQISILLRVIRVMKKKLGRSMIVYP